MLLFWIWLAVATVAVYLFVKRKLQYKRIGVKQMSFWQSCKNILNLMFSRTHMVDIMLNFYNDFPEERFVGRSVDFLGRGISIRDPELIKQITVKDFEHFADHKVFVTEDVDPFFGKNLFSLQGQKWRDMRSTLSPAFTASKLKYMVPFMLQCGKDTAEYMKNQIKEGKEDHVDLDTKNLCTKYTNDVIATCAFGLQVNSLVDENNQFYVMGKLLSKFSLTNLLKFIFLAVLPKLAKNLGVRLLHQDSTKFFKSTVADTMQYREENNVHRPDMIQLLMEAKKGNLKHDQKGMEEDVSFAVSNDEGVALANAKRVWTDEDIAAQAMLFFAAGFETVATIMNFLLYELAIHPDIQKRLAEEIDATKVKGPLTFALIQDMVYMDMVVSECLRKWTPGIALERLCVKSYNLGRPNAQAKKDVIITEGMSISIPTWAIHRDPAYFEEPERFNPERFSEENKHKIKPYTYLPFGLGPRNCIGSRFALLEVKILVHQILSQFVVEPAKTTPIPIKLTKSFQLLIEGDNNLRFKLRT